MQDDTYKTLTSPSEGVYKEKGSKFLAYAHPVENVAEVKSLVERYRKTFYDARHVCFAYVLDVDGVEFRANDDGEPSGTAGRPILGQIQSFGLCKVLVVVVRYFGGILLGTGGLVVAYRAAAFEALSVAEVVERTVDVDLRFRFEFPYMNDVMKLVKKFEAKIVDQSYETDCFMILRIRKGEVVRLHEALLKIDGVRMDDKSPSSQ
jgi:uncharacterized YigZ family protein